MVLNYNVELIFKTLIMFSFCLLLFVKFFNLSTPIVWYIRAIGLTERNLTIYEHICVITVATKSVLKCTRHDRSHCWIVEFKPILNKGWFWICNGKVTQVVVEFNRCLFWWSRLFLLFILLFLIALIFFLFWFFWSFYWLDSLLLRFVIEHFWNFEIPLSLAKIVFYVCVVVTSIRTASMNNNSF